MHYIVLGYVVYCAVTGIGIAELVKHKVMKE